MFVYEIPALLKCIWNVLRIFLRTRDSYFSSHQNLIAFDLPPFLTKWKHMYPRSSFLVPDTLTADSSEWLACSTENPGLQGKCSVGIRLEKRWTRLGIAWKWQLFSFSWKLWLRCDIRHFTVKLTGFSGIFLKDGWTVWVTHH